MLIAKAYGEIREGYATASDKQGYYNSYWFLFFKYYLCQRFYVVGPV